MKLSRQQVDALRALADGKPHETAPARRDEYIGGVTAASLARLKLATSAGVWPITYTITDAGRDALADIDGAGRQGRLA